MTLTATGLKIVCSTTAEYNASLALLQANARGVFSSVSGNAATKTLTFSISARFP